MNLLRASALQSGVFSSALVLFLLVLSASAQPAPSGTIRFRDVTENSGIRFTHFKGNQGISINLEESEGCAAAGAWSEGPDLTDRAARKSNRDALGARIRITTGGTTQMREIAGGGSYLSRSDVRQLRPR
jgi:hypothetical protein